MMHLHRHGTVFNQASSSSSYTSASRRKHLDGRFAAIYDFPSFGNGDERNSHFSVFVEWEDVEKMIAAFADAGHPAAFKLLSDTRALAVIRDTLATESSIAGDGPSLRDLSKANR